MHDSLAGFELKGAARDYAQHNTARQLVERVLWEGFTSGSARGHLVAALAGDDHPATLELLGAVVRQAADPDLARSALALWPSGADTAAVRHAAAWATDPGVREAARAVLARELPEDLAVLAAPR